MDCFVALLLAMTEALLVALDRPGYAHRHRKRLFALRHRCAGGHGCRHLATKYRHGRAFFGNADRLAERHASDLGIDLGFAACVRDRLLAGLVEYFRSLRHREVDAT